MIIGFKNGMILHIDFTNTRLMGKYNYNGKDIIKSTEIYQICIDPY